MLWTSFKTNHLFYLKKLTSSHANNHQEATNIIDLLYGWVQIREEKLLAKACPILIYIDLDSLLNVPKRGFSVWPWF